jgi:hypothetical protein
MMRFANRIDGLSDNNDTRKLEGRKFLLQNWWSTKWNFSIRE